MSADALGGGGAVARAWERSFFSKLPPASAQAILASAHEEAIEPGQNIYRELAEPRFAFVAIVVSGLLRVYVTSPTGRRITIRYVREGEVVGLPSLLVQGAPAGGEAIVRGSILRIDPPTVRRLATEDPAVGWTIAVELAQQLIHDERMLTSNVFGTVRERVARHLLELGVLQGDRLVVRITQQELADSIGSVREVVARVMIGLRDDGLLEREGERVVVLGHERLARIARGEEAV